ncbi:PREDICTED: insulin-like peptide receptor isoform X2 [Priapulus caudatus]|uniref:Tyrosine-protein kinase receptor n=1 Tax=Priapulus caudatus TaxID=37621 RepID=A0ABM1DZJ5_PRICU|nr:PREDICTED: insulin-like peptide receptor isoform X2 [Priapulus caudatus]
MIIKGQSCVVSPLLVLTLLGLTSAFSFGPNFVPPEPPPAVRIKRSPRDIRDGVCQNIDIRNNVSNLMALENCTIIDGYLRVLLIDRGSWEMYQNYSFPKLREINGYLFMYRVSGLQSLRTLFPNLAVIRGRDLVFNYAFVLYEMFDLREIGLANLATISRGGVRIEKNPALCFVHTINWKTILNNSNPDTELEQANFILENKDPDLCNECPSSLGCHDNTCWTARDCQINFNSQCPKCNSRMCNTSDVPGICCHEQCLGGCYGERNNDCVACKHVLDQEGHCTEKCAPETYLLNGIRCISEDDCVSGEGRSGPGHSWILHNQVCRRDCPTGWTKNESNPNYCKHCGEACPRICPGAYIDSVTAAQKYKGCTVIDGTLEIQVRSGKNIVKELEANLYSIHTVKHYVKIARSFPLVSLSFLRNLREIGGERLLNNKHAFVVLDNQNLEDIWDVNLHVNLTILKGKMFFHYNPKLCPNNITQWANAVIMPEDQRKGMDDTDISLTSNGDKVACDIQMLRIEVRPIDGELAIVKWDNYRTDDPRSLLGFVIYCREALHQNLTIFDGRDACGSNDWRMVDVAAPEEDNYSNSTRGFDDTSNLEITELLGDLKPYTQYAVYVKTYTIARESQGAQSNIFYFTTKSSEPTPPRSVTVKADVNSLRINWEAPLHPNGIITHYEVRFQQIPDDPENYKDWNVCSDIRHKKGHDSDGETSTPPQVPTIPKPTTPTGTDGDCPVCDCDQPVKKTPAEEEKTNQIVFENFLHNMVYQKRDIGSEYDRIVSPETKFPTAIPNRRRREISPMDRRDSAVPTELSVSINETYAVTDDDDGVPIGNETKVEEVPTLVTKDLAVELENLHHFTFYTIEVRACHAYDKDTGTKLCSTIAMTTGNTLPKADADLINSTIEVLVNSSSSSMKSTVIIKWTDPLQPNGVILGYSMKFMDGASSSNTTAVSCFTKSQIFAHGGIILYRGEGNYSFQLGIISLGTLPYQDHTTYWTEQRYRAHELLNGSLITSINPEYMSSADVYNPDEWEVGRDKINLIRELGQGSFGMVYEGEVKDLVLPNEKTRCAVKTVNESASIRERIEFLKEASVMKAFNCHHVVKLLGVVSIGQPTLVVMELMGNGDLKTYLRMHRPEIENAKHNREPPTDREFLGWAGEIADGMAYLSAKKFVHRDLAARNCMVASDLTVKIGDFGMTRDIYETDYYRKGGKGLLPVRWMGPESLKDGVFTSQSDVWSYGVVLWEMATLASQPYQGLSNEEVLKYVISGGIMDKPEDCPDQFYELMKLCWQQSQKQRPTFIEIIEILRDDLPVSFREQSFYDQEYLKEQQHSLLDCQYDDRVGAQIGELEEISLHSRHSDESLNMQNTPQEDCHNCMGQLGDTSPHEEQRPLSGRNSAISMSGDGSKGSSKGSSSTTSKSSGYQLMNGGMANGHLHMSTCVPKTTEC